jgi:hypothetical protein
LEPQKGTEEVTKDLGPGIHPLLVMSTPAGGAVKVELHLKRVDIADMVASYQGELSYDSRALTFSRAELPAGVMGASNEVEPGRLRFTGMAPDGLKDGAVLVLHFVAKGTLGTNPFQLRMEEVISNKGFQSLTERVIKRENPLLARAPAE